MTPTPTSGAAIQRYKIGYHAEEWSQRDRTPSGIPDASGSWVRYADHVTALATGQATAAPAEPDPTPGDHPQPCDSELFESGVSVGLFDIPQWTAEALCKGIAAATGARVDWHYIGGRVHVKALPAPTSAEGVAYAELPDEREMLKHALWLTSSFTVHRYLMSNAEGRWSGAEKATCHDELCCLYVAVFRGAEVDRVRVDFEADWVAVHDATQELTDHMDVVIGFPLKGVPDYEALAPKFFAYFHWLAAHALRASHGQAPAGATLPDGWVPLMLRHEGQYPEEVAYGPPIMMDRLGKWLGKYFAQAAPADSVQEDAAQQPRLTVRLTAFPESNGKQNWTALLVRADKWDGLVGNCGGISLARGELWNRVAYGAECARFLIGERDTEPFILDYGDDIKTPEEWKGEVYGGRKPRGAARKQGANQ